MSECVVRMEMPKGCWDCPCVNGEYGYCQADKEERQIEDPNERPSWCPIICQLPEEHGRLVDADVILQYLREKTAMFDAVDGKMELVSLTIRNDLQGFIKTILETPTIVPAERSET